jgi:hypothetical protein
MTQIARHERTLAELEQIVDAGKCSFIDMGFALKEIRDRRLWEATDASFDAYCVRRFEFKKARAYQIIQAADVTTDLSTAVEKTALPQRERQVRALAKVEPERRAEVWQAAKASSNGKEPTTAVIAAVAKRQPPELDPQDEAGQPIPAKLRPAFDNVARFDNALQALSEIASELNPLMGDANDVKPLPGGEFLAAQRQYIKTGLKNLRETLKATRPYAVCPYCKGGKAKCEACKGAGYLPRAVYEEAPKEMKR